MRAGELDRLVTIEVNTQTRTASGDTVDSWGTFATVWARRMDARTGGREFFAADQTIGEAATVWRLRWLDGVRTKMRLVDGGDIWDIEGIAESGARREGLELTCTRQGA